MSTVASDSNVSTLTKFQAHMNSRFGKPKSASERFEIEDTDLNDPSRCNCLNSASTYQDIQLHNYTASLHLTMEQHRKELGVTDVAEQEHLFTGLYDTYYTVRGTKSLRDLNLDERQRDAISLAVHKDFGPSVNDLPEVIGEMSAGNAIFSIMNKQRRRTSSEYSVDAKQTGDDFLQSVGTFLTYLPEGEIGSRAMMSALADAVIQSEDVTIQELNEKNFLDTKDLLVKTFSKTNSELTGQSAQVDKLLATHISGTRLGMYRAARQRKESVASLAERTANLSV